MGAKRVAAVMALLAGLGLAAARANDSTAVIESGDLQITANPDIAMVAEELFVSAKEVRVAYRFHNASQRPIDTLVAFPLPDITVGEDVQYDVESGEAENFIGFEASAGERRLAPALNLRATRHGVDRTGLLAAHGLPVLPFGDLYDRLERLRPDARAALEAADLVDWHTSFGAGGKPLPNAHWTARAAFHWRQRFPAGETVAVGHRYRPVAGVTFFSQHTLDDPRMRRTYCMEDDFLRAARNRLAQSPGGMVRVIHYVLTTANNWRGPIGEFRLVVDKGAPENLVSLCRGGIRKTGATTFEFRARNFVPKDDLKVLIIESAPRG